jgi:release factor glutamine methyltransferase
MVDRRVAGVPLEYVLGWAEFCGLRIAVDTAVFVPRRRTEFLVREAAELLRAADDGPGTPGAPAVRTPVVLDMCCGSGAIGAALAAIVGAIDLYATDVDPAAVRCARRNVAAAGGRVFSGDLFEPLPPALRGRVEILAANAPYVPTDAIGMMPPEARLHERLVALDGGPDGLDVVRRVAAQAREWLAPGGHLLVEANERQAPPAAESFARNGLTPRVVHSEEFGATLVVGTFIGTFIGTVVGTRGVGTGDGPAGAPA